jgi:hypothetical protein
MQGVVYASRAWRRILWRFHVCNKLLWEMYVNLFRRNHIPRFYPLIFHKSSHLNWVLQQICRSIVDIQPIIQYIKISRSSTDLIKRSKKGMSFKQAFMWGQGKIALRLCYTQRINFLNILTITNKQSHEYGVGYKYSAHKLC